MHKINKTVSVEETNVLENPINAKILSLKLRDMMKSLEGKKDRFVLNFRKLNEDYNRHRILNYYYEYLMQRPIYNFKNIDKINQRLINNYYYACFHFINND
jgi:hypothetical protein